MTTKTNQLDMAAEILAQYIDETSTKAAEVFLSRGAPFAADVSQDDLLEYYRAQLFNPDGSPNYAGRTQQIQRLGAEGFARLFKQVTGIKRDESVPPQPESVPVPVPIPAPPPMPMPMPMPMPGVGSGG